MKIYSGSVRLGIGHSLIVGHGPRLARLEALKKEDAARVASFGLFEVGTPDTHTYYKDVKEEDLTPKAEDFIKPVFRGLSEVIVRKQIDPIDFGHNKGVLKDSAPLLMGQSVFTNHEALVGNEVGVVSNTFWDNGYFDNGFNIPAGINFEAMIDGKLHPNLCRKLLAPIPSVHSNSVTVQFKFAQSHPKMSFEEFRGKVGKYDANKELIRRIVTGIDGYHETSFVAHGADPYAQMIKDGKIINPKYAHDRDSFSEGKNVSYYFFSDFKTSLSEDETIPDELIISENEDSDSNKNKKQGMRKELILLMALLSGVSLTAEEQAISAEEFSDKFDYAAFDAKVLANKTQLEGLQALSDQGGEVTRLTNELATAKKFETDNAPKIADLSIVDKYKAAQLAELMRVSAVVNGKAPEASLKETYEKADLGTLEAFLKPLQSQLEEKFPMECKKCLSHDVGRASAEVDEDGKPKVKPTTLSASDSIREKARRKANTSFLGSK